MRFDGWNDGGGWNGETNVTKKKGLVGKELGEALERGAQSLEVARQGSILHGGGGMGWLGQC